MPRILSLILLCSVACNTTTRVGGALATPEPYAAAEGAAILRKGGNAIDAAVCVGFVLAVTHPYAGNLGGGGFIVVHTRDGDDIIDARETAPGAASADMYLDAEGNFKKGASLVGPLAAGVPGSVAGYLLLLKKYGTMDRETLLEPAIRLAENGFRVDRGLRARIAEHRAFLSLFAETRDVFLPGGKVPEVGDTLRQPALAKVLRAIAEYGRDGFYDGWFADEAARINKKYGGVMTADDLRKYEPTLRRPLRGTFAGHEIVTMPPPSSGGVVLLQILKMVESANHEGMRAEQRRHVFLEASRRAFADRAQYFGDPDFVDVPVDRLLDDAYLASRLATIDMARATSSDDVAPGLGLPKESTETCHFSIIDDKGNAVSCTTTLNGAFGCATSVSGVLLNNEMDDFAAKVGVPNQFGLLQGVKNAIEPGKRPLSSMTPTILLRDNKPVLALGSPGGPTIITSVASVLMRHLLDGMSLQEAIRAPRLHCQWRPDEVVHEPLSRADERWLIDHRQKLREVPRIGDVQAVARTRSGRLLPLSDPRGRGAVAGPE